MIAGVLFVAGVAIMYSFGFGAGLLAIALGAAAAGWFARRRSGDRP